VAGPTVGITGTVTKVVLYYYSNYFTIFQLETDDGEYRCLGNMPNVYDGMQVNLRGHWENHYLHGKTFHFNYYSVIDDTSDRAVHGFLKSIKGVGKKTADKFVERNAGHAYSSLLEMDFDWLSSNQRENVVRAVEKHIKLKELLPYFAKVLDYSDMLEMAANMSGSEIDDLLRNPYNLVYITDVNAKMLDSQGYHMDANENDRIKAHLYSYLKKKATFSGNYITNELSALKGIRKSTKAKIDSIDNYVDNDKVLKSEDRLKLGEIHRNEIEIIKRFNTIFENKEIGEFDDQIANRAANRISQDMKFKISSEQINACRSVHDGVSCITGFPGTGKTITIMLLEYYCFEKGLKTMILTPTGAAAKRLEEISIPASTIHRAVGYDGKKTKKHKDDPLISDVFIVDEASMVSYDTMLLLLRAMPKGSTVVFVGDPDQLPPVEIGRPFVDMVKSEALPTYRLTEIYRQKGQGLIKAARSVLDGKMPPDWTIGKGYYFDLQDNVKDRIVDTVKRMSKQFGNVHKFIYKTMLMSPMRRRGTASTEALNAEISSIVGKDGDRKKTILGTGFRQDDFVVNTKNNYNKEIYNGDKGVIKYDVVNGPRVFFLNKSEYVPFKEWELDRLELAYCTTIHRAQGQESKNIIVPLETQAYSMWNRNMLYTALTRAKENAMVVVKESDAQELMYAIVGKKDDYRTEFCDMLQDKILVRR